VKSLRELSPSLLAKWKGRKLPAQIFGVIRHAERADCMWGTYGGGRWTQTEDSYRWSVDPPLSDAGQQGATEIGNLVHNFAEESESAFHVVITSPYLRCVQTAAEICRALGPGVRLLVDRSLGEVFGPSVLGEVEPSSPVRPMMETEATCHDYGAKLVHRVIGTWPVWPEDLRSARRRYADRFLTYLNRSSVTKRNFLLVTHADGVGAALGMMPSQVGTVVERVEFGGLFLGRRKQQGFELSVQSSSSEPRSRLPAIDSEESISSMASMVNADMGSQRTACLGEHLWSDIEEIGSPKKKQPGVPKASDGWQVMTHDISLRTLHDETSIRSRLRRQLKHSSFSRERMELLLGTLSDRPLGGNSDVAGLDWMGQQLSERRSNCTFVSYSTYLFGGSGETILTLDEEGMDSCGTPSIESLKAVAWAKKPLASFRRQISSRSPNCGAPLMGPRKNISWESQGSAGTPAYSEKSEFGPYNSEAFPPMSPYMSSPKRQISAKQMNVVGTPMVQRAQADLRLNSPSQSALMTRRKGPQLAGLSLPMTATATL